MSLHLIKKIPTASELQEILPMTPELQQIKKERDEMIRKVFTGESDQFIMIIGPCSADNEAAVLDYVTRLAKVQEEVKGKVLLIPRIYTNKPRTTGAGYKGMLHQPDPEKAPDMFEGVKAIRKMHIDAISQTGLTAADEMLYSENWQYLEDILSYVAIGARSVEDQQHRIVTSGMDIPVGMKNPTSGNLTVMLNSCLAGQMKHTFLYTGWETKSDGNELVHCILRGASNKHGQSISNYHYEDLILLHELYQQFELKNPACIVDANHNNSGKQWEEQPRIVKEVLHSMRHSNDICKLVKGVMVESYIEDGCQSVDGGIYGKSITDPCLGWEKSRELILEVADLL